MFSLIQSNADLHHGTESSDSSSTAETMSIGSLEEAISGPSPSTENEPRIHVLQPEENARSTLLATPSCDFLVDYLFSECYSTLFTLYSEKCQTSDNRYWTRIMYLSSYTDAHLLRYFDVKKYRNLINLMSLPTFSELWPINFENTRELDTFTVITLLHTNEYASLRSAWVPKTSFTARWVSSISIVLQGSCNEETMLSSSRDQSLDHRFHGLIFYFRRSPSSKNSVARSTRQTNWQSSPTHSLK